MFGCNKCIQFVFRLWPDRGRDRAHTEEEDSDPNKQLMGSLPPADLPLDHSALWQLPLQGEEERVQELAQFIQEEQDQQHREVQLQIYTFQDYIGFLLEERQALQLQYMMRESRENMVERLELTAPRKAGSGLECSVCLQTWESEVAWRELPCGHSFHSMCIDEWVVIQPECPLCRTNVFEL